MGGPHEITCLLYVTCIRRTHPSICRILCMGLHLQLFGATRPYTLYRKKHAHIRHMGATFLYTLPGPKHSYQSQGVIPPSYPSPSLRATRPSTFLGQLHTRGLRATCPNPSQGDKCTAHRNIVGATCPNTLHGQHAHIHLKGNTPIYTLRATRPYTTWGQHAHIHLGGNIPIYIAWATHPYTS